MPLCARVALRIPLLWAMSLWSAHRPSRGLGADQREMAETRRQTPAGKAVRHGRGRMGRQVHVRGKTTTLDGKTFRRMAQGEVLHRNL